LRQRLARAFDRFHDVRELSDVAAARLIRDLDIDIAIDLMGHTQDSRTGILARRPAPVQVSYLGYSATMGADFIDYILGDALVTPMERQGDYAERIVQLPESFWIGGEADIAGRIASRADEGLPSEGFVFCCFNAAAKLTPEVFDIWMNLLAGAPGSVLWLQSGGKTANANLAGAAGARGIDPSRLVFARWVERREDHLARHRLADLFLDTLPYNAHATAADALRSGLPVVTCAGQSFAGRVAASLLSAAGLPELIADNLSTYQDLALHLAHDRPALDDIRTKLGAHLVTHPLFHTARSIRHIEAAYQTMRNLADRGAEPAGFRVTAIDG
jgi:predicted O-linked N-acetylglucosamine transferase (SPINDLY family)